MSFKVLVIPEDPTNNGYILKPLVERMLAELGKPNARVQVLTNPHIRGYQHAVQAIQSELDRYKFFDLWLFLPDGDLGTVAKLTALEEKVRSQNVTLFCCGARLEAEVWVMAGHLDKLRRMNPRVTWEEVRNHPTLKETFFEPFLREYGNPQSAGGGRKELMLETLNNYQGLLDRCDELKELHRRLSEYLQSP